jgi:uncharacterized protein DUF664
VPTDEEIGFPTGNADEKELLLSFLRFLRGAVLRKVAGLDDEQARWTPDGKLIPLIGIVHHLTSVERRWIDGGFLGHTVSRSEEEFRPARALTVAAAVDAYKVRGGATDAIVRDLPLDTPCERGDDHTRDLRWVLVHLINETGRHAGHADATRELLDGVTGE